MWLYLNTIRLLLGRKKKSTCEAMKILQHKDKQQAKTEVLWEKISLRKQVNIKSYLLCSFKKN